MTHDDPEHLVERFADGEMTAAEEQALLKRAASDMELRRMLDAEQVIGRAVAHDMTVLPRTGIQPSASIMSKLAASRASLTGPAATTPGVAASFLNGAIMPTLIAVVGVVAIVTGVYISTSSESQQEHHDSTFVATPSLITAPVDTLNSVEQLPTTDTSPQRTTEVRLESPTRGSDETSSRRRKQSSPAIVQPQAESKPAVKDADIPVLQSKKAQTTIRMNDTNAR